MKAVIILFSPSGNTLRAGEILKSCLAENDVQVQLIDITRDKNYHFSADKQNYLKTAVKEHDLLFLGAPVYAHHLQYHMADLINALPYPGNGWGRIAVPFVTYGGLNSGIALDEAGKLLKKSGRRVPVGVKLSASHRMTRGFMEEEYNKDQPESITIDVMNQLVNILQSENQLRDNSKKLRYQGFVSYLQANLIFVEKTCHEKRYPKIVIDNDKCIKCGKCIRICPVCHLAEGLDGSIVKNSRTNCIHCFDCIVDCPEKAISPVGDLEKAREFMNSMIKKGKESPETCIYPNRF
jgi:ferredoxin/flavodoxin